MSFTSAQIISWIIAYKYFVLFPVTIVEGPIITIISGFLVSLGFLNGFIVYFVIMAGDLAGDVLFYYIGLKGRGKFSRKILHFIGLTQPRIELLEKHFEQHSGKTLIFGKLSHAIGAPILVTAGIAKMRFSKFIWFNFFATVPKSLILLLIGIYFGHAYAKIGKYLDYTTYAAIILGCILILLYFFISKTAKKYLKE